MIRSLILLTALFVMPLAAHAGQTLVFSLPEAEPAYVGFAVLREAYSRIGIQAKYKRMPALRCLEASNAGITDGEVDRTTAIEETYRNLVRVNEPVQIVENLAVIARPNPAITDLESIRNLRVGILDGFKIAMDATEGFPNVYKAGSWDRLFDLLILTRLDVVAPRQVLAHQLERVDRKRLIGIEPPLVRTPLFHYLHKKHARLAPKIEQALRDIMESGEYSNIRLRAKDREGTAWNTGQPDSAIKN